MKPAIGLLSLLALLPYALADDAKPPAGRLPASSEVVMSPGMRITATTSVGTIAITAVDELTRSYTWDGETRAAQMTRRATTTGRVRGSLGIFHDITSVHWPNHHGITRGIMEEGQQHFSTVEEAMKWVKKRSACLAGCPAGYESTAFVYRDDGLMVGWSKDLQRNRLNVEVWQIRFEGKKPKRLPGSQDDKIVVETAKTETVPPAKGVASNVRQTVKSLAVEGSEIVMSPGMRITATTRVGAIAITAVDELTRAYTWEGATRAVEMHPRAITTGRWLGSLGLFFPGPGEHWREHHGIKRCVTEEGQQHFKTAEEAIRWIKQNDWMPFVYRDDGLTVGWDKNLDRMQLSVDVWQILIDGKKPKGLPGSQNDKIVVETVETETVPLVKAVASNDLKTATALLAQGADPNVKNSVEIPVLFMAIRNESAPIVEALLKNKADPNIRDPDTDLTPLIGAISSAELVKMLLDAGADANAASRRDGDLLMGMTPLIVAAGEGFEDVVRLLLGKGADVNVKTSSGFSALSWANEIQGEDRRGVVRMLEAAGAK